MDFAIPIIPPCYRFQVTILIVLRFSVGLVPLIFSLPSYEFILYKTGTLNYFALG